MRSTLFIYLLTVIYASTLRGQVSDTLLTAQKVYLADKTSYVGRILNINSTEVEILIGSDTLLLDRNKVEKVDLKWRPQNDDPVYQYSRSKIKPPVDFHGAESIHLTPTAFTYPKGEWEYRNTSIFINQINTGITDDISAGAIIVITPEPIFLMGLGGKIGQQINEDLRISLSNYYFITSDNRSDVNWTSGAITIGKEDLFISLNAGYYIGNSEFLENGWTSGFTGSYRFARQWRVYADGLFIYHRNRPAFAGAGVGWFNQRNRIDFGLKLIGEQSFYFPFPAISYSRRFGNNRR